MSLDPPIGRVSVAQTAQNGWQAGEMMAKAGQFFRVLAICLGGWGATVGPASAQFAVCNQTFDVVNVAIGSFEDDSFQTRGWWTIGPNQCANVIQSELRARYVYVFAQDVFGKTILTGSAPMCVAPERFEIVGESDCLVRGFIEARFHEVDTQRTERWTFFLNPPPS